MSPQQCPLYEPNPAHPGWLHVLYGFGGPHSCRQELLLAPSEHSSLSANLLYLLTEDLGRLDSSGAFALAFANLSRRAPGRRCLGIYVATRVAQGIDELGRSNSTFKHAAAACERQLDADSLQQAALALIQSNVGGDPQRRLTPLAHGHYQRYLRAQQGGASQVRAAAEALVPYVQALDLGCPPPAEAVEPALISLTPSQRTFYITYPPGQDLVSLVLPCARVALMLYSAGLLARPGAAVAWTSVELGAGHPLDTRDGITVRFTQESELPDDGAELVLPLAKLPPWRSEDGYGRDFLELMLRGRRRESLRRRDGSSGSGQEPAAFALGHSAPFSLSDAEESSRKRSTIVMGEEAERSSVRAGGEDANTTHAMAAVSPPGPDSGMIVRGALPSAVTRPTWPLRARLRPLLSILEKGLRRLWSAVLLMAAIEILWPGTFGFLHRGAGAAPGRARAGEPSKPLASAAPATAPEIAAGPTVAVSRIPRPATGPNNDAPASSRLCSCGQSANAGVHPAPGSGTTGPAPKPAAAPKSQSGRKPLPHGPPTDPPADPPAAGTTEPSPPDARKPPPQAFIESLAAGH